MSCQLSPFSWFDPNVIKKRLFSEKSIDSLRTRLSWPEEFDDDKHQSSSDSSFAWLQECYVYLSPSREILVFADNTSVIILTSKWESQTKNNVSSKYVLLWSGNVQQDKTEEITSIVCLPLASVGRSSHHGTDWTCIIVGYSSGYVRFYTENGILMTSELFHEEPVLHIKCKSYRASSYPGEVEHQEELLVTYQSAVVSLNGFALFQTLRGCRSHLARVKANCGEVTKPPPLGYKKWGFTEQRISAERLGITDCEVVGPCTPHSFDHLHQHHLMSAQLSSVANWKPRAPATSMVVATGGHPFVGFHYSVEGASRQVIYHDVARAVTGKLKETLSSTVSAWIFGGQNPQTSTVEEKINVEPADPMQCRFGLCDPLRKGDCIVMTHNRKLSAVVDNLGRIILVDNFKGMAVRLWKGYRDAQCGWIEVYEESFSHRGHASSGSREKQESSSATIHSPPRMAHFLVVHCPRSNMLQVLSVQKGSKIAAIRVAKGSRFLYISHGIVGTNNVPQKKKRYYVESSCVIIEPDGVLKEVSVPFHFALSEESSEKVRDLHLIRQIKRTLRNASAKGDDTGNEDETTADKELSTHIEELKCDESLMLALQTISTSQHTTPPLFLSAINIILKRLENRSSDKSANLLWRMCHQLRQLINLYTEAHTSFDRKESRKSVSDIEDAPKPTEEENLKILMKEIKMREYEAKDILNLVKLFQSTRGARHREHAVTFNEKQCFSLADFISCFSLIEIKEKVEDFDSLESTKEDTNSSLPIPVSLKIKIKEENMEHICRLLFYCSLAGKNLPKNWKYAIASSGICTRDLLVMAILTWLQHGWQFLEYSIVDIFQRLLSTIQAVLTMKDALEVTAEDSDDQWWKDIQTLLTSWKSPFLALIGALPVRTIVLNHIPCEVKSDNGESVEGDSNFSEKDKDKANTENVIQKEEGWEPVSVEGMVWDKLIHNLEDLSYLEAAISWPYLRSPTTISLEEIIEKGRGCVSEMVAQWVLKCNVTFGSDNWCPNSLISFMEKTSVDESWKENEESAAFQALGLLSLLRTRFPFSLSASSLVANVCWESARCFTSQDYRSIPVLSNTLEWLQSIPSSQIRRGLCGLLWTVHLEHRIKSAAQLLECYPYMDAIPERIMMDEVGLPSLMMLHDLFRNAYKFLDIMVELEISDFEEEETDEENLRWEEDLWGPPEKQMLQQSGRGGPPPPLVELALLQPSIPSSLDQHRLIPYHKLCIVLCLISHIHPKGPSSLSQPISQLFNIEERNLLQSASEGDIRIKREKYSAIPVTTACKSFIKKSISAVCRSTDYDENLQSKEMIRLIYKTAQMFGLPLDEIRRHHVCELYSCGHDTQAEELMATVIGKENLASQLLLIVFQRLKYYIDQCGNDHSEVVSNFSPASLAWLNSQQSSSLFCKDIPMRRTEQLLNISLAYISEESSIYSEALGVLDGVRVLASR